MVPQACPCRQRPRRAGRPALARRAL